MVPIYIHASLELRLEYLCNLSGNMLSAQFKDVGMSINFSFIGKVRPPEKG